MTHKRISTVAEVCQITRPVRLEFIAITVVAGIMAVRGWHLSAGVLGGVLVVIAGLTVFEIHRGVGRLHRRSDMVRKAAEEAEKHYIQVLWRIVRVVESRDRYTEGHSERVSDLSEQIARKINLPEETCAKLKIAARLHDLGMLAVPHRILRQQDELGMDDLHIVRVHSEVAYQVLKPLQSLGRVLPAIRHHHERMNGTGYPSGLCGEEIPIEARILAVADAYDAMTHDRAYRPAMTAVTAMNEIRRCTPAGYDPACVDALGELKHFPELREAMVPV